VLKRWNTTETILLRLAREGKVKIGFDPPYPFPVSVFGSWIDDDGVEHVNEIPSDMLHRATLCTLDDTSKNLIVINNKILLLPSGVPNHEQPEFHFKRVFFPLYMDLWPKETLPWLNELPHNWFLMVPLSIQAEMNKELNLVGDLLTAVAAENKCRIPIHRIVIPTSEIHRIEHQHEAAEKAAAEDVLGTKDKEKTQAIIAAMSQIIATAAPGYKHGDRPNAARIAEKIEETGLVDRKKETIAKEISAAWARFGR
jgi:hypothetical protein